MVIEATGNAASAAEVMQPHVEKMVIENISRCVSIDYAKIKTDTIDEGVLAQLYARGFLPEDWIYNERNAGAA